MNYLTEKPLYNKYNEVQAITIDMKDVLTLLVNLYPEFKAELTQESDEYGFDNSITLSSDKNSLTIDKQTDYVECFFGHYADINSVRIHNNYESNIIKFIEASRKELSNTKKTVVEVSTEEEFY